MSSVIDFLDTAAFTKEYGQASEMMKKVIHRGRYDLRFRYKYNKRDDVKATRKLYMKDRNRQIKDENAEAKALLQNKAVMDLAKKLGLKKK